MRGLLVALLLLVAGPAYGLTYIDPECGPGVGCECVQRQEPPYLTERALLHCEFQHADGTLAWTHYHHMPYPPNTDARHLLTWLAPLDPDPWKGRCRARGEFLMGDGKPACIGDERDDWCIGDWSDWCDMDGKPVPLPEPAVWLGLAAGIVLLAAIARWRNRT